MTTSINSMLRKIAAAMVENNYNVKQC